MALEFVEGGIGEVLISYEKGFDWIARVVSEVKKWPQEFRQPGKS